MVHVPEPVVGRLATIPEWRKALELAEAGYEFTEDTEWKSMAGYFEA